MRKIFAAFAAALLLCSAAVAADTLTIPANKTTAVGRFFVYNPVNCYNPGQLSSKIVKQPQHGKITVTFEKQVVPKSSKECAGTSTRAAIVRYTPNRGYRGKDEAAVSISFPEFYGGYGSKISRRMKFDLVVK